MTTLRVEVARRDGTTVEDVVAGLRLAGCMKDIEIIPNGWHHLPIEELRDALIAEGFWVEVVPDPPPPPLPFWMRVRALPRRAYLWGRRLVLHETEEEQLLEAMFGAYRGADKLHEVTMRPSPILQRLQRPEESEDTERFILRGRGTGHRDDS